MRRDVFAIPGARCLVLGWSCLLVGTAPSWGQSGGKVCVDPSKPEKCFPTIQEGVDAAFPGQLVEIAKGDYVESVRIDTTTLTMKGAGKDKTILRAPPGTDALTLGATGITVKLLTVRGSSSAFGGNGIVVERGADGSRIRDVVVTRMSPRGWTTTSKAGTAFGSWHGAYASRTARSAAAAETGSRSETKSTTSTPAIRSGGAPPAPVRPRSSGTPSRAAARNASMPAATSCCSRRT